MKVQEEEGTGVEEKFVLFRIMLVTELSPCAGSWA